MSRIRPGWPPIGAAPRIEERGLWQLDNHRPELMHDEEVAFVLHVGGDDGNEIYRNVERAFKALGWHWPESNRSEP